MTTPGQAATLGRWQSGGASTAPWTAIAGVLLLIGLAAFLVDRRLGIGVCAVLAAPIFVLAPEKGLLIFIAALPFDGVSSLEADRMLSLTRVLGLAVIGGWLLNLLAQQRRVIITRGAWWLIAYVGFAALSIVWATDRDVTRAALLTLGQLLLLCVVATNVLRTPRDVERAIDVLIASATVLALVVLWQMPIGAKRVSFTFGASSVNPNYLAASLVFPAVAAIGRGRSRGPFGWWRLASAVPLVIAIALTGSRGGGFAFLGGIAMIGVLRRRLGLRLVAGGVALAVLLPAAFPQTVDRLWNRYSAAEQDRLSGRMDIWRVAFAMVEDHPLQGTAYGGFQDAFYDYMVRTDVDPVFARAHSRGNRNAHNIYIANLAELGIVGFGLLIVALASHVRALWRAWGIALWARDEALAALCVALLGVFASLVLFGTTIDLFGTKEPWIWLAAIEASACIALADVRVLAGARVRPS